MWVCAADHLMTAPEQLLAAVADGAEAARAGHLVTFGITATRPETGYGYIQEGAPLAVAARVLKAARFVEKPDRPTAEAMLAEGGFVWNSGMFLFRSSAIKAELAAHAPDILEAVTAALGPIGADGAAIDPARFAAVPSAPIDKAVMERSDRVAVVPCAPGWSDVGSWHAIWEIAEHDGHGNALKGDARVLAGRNNLVRSDGRLVAVAGVDDLAVVETADAVLVTRREDADTVKLLVGALVAEDRVETVRHRREPLAWGILTRLAERPGYALCERLIDPGASVPVTVDGGASIVWTVVAGSLRLEGGEVRQLVGRGESAAGTPGKRYSLVNEGPTALLVLELRLA